MARNYRQYKKKVKKLGAKQIATPEEFAIVQQRLDRVYKGLKQAGLTQKEIDRLRGKR